ncbi:MAG: DUF418 domain-containing protein [Planctomycetota bacterium]|nr:DUF418 domain-containing protein [Planctomycetota bacterium]
MSEQTVTPVPTQEFRFDPSGPLTVKSKTRLIALDTIRGFAILGILMLNIVDFAWPNQAYDNVTQLYYSTDSVGKIPEQEKSPANDKRNDWQNLDSHKPDLKSFYPAAKVSIAAVSSTADVVEWILANILFANKMRTLFCIMFGAGMIFLSKRSTDNGNRHIGIYYRRILILLLFGALHGYLIWHGDILFAYAGIGLYLYPFRNYSSNTLLGISFSLFFAFISLLWTSAGVIHHIQTHGLNLERRVRAAAPDLARLVQQSASKDLETLEKARSQARRSAVQSLSAFDQLILRAHLELSRNDLAQKPEELTQNIHKYRSGSYLGMVQDRAGEIFGMQIAFITPVSLIFIGWLMILGMSLAKSGFFAGDWPLATYRLWAFWLVPLGWIIEAGLISSGANSLQKNPLMSLTIWTPIHQAVIPMLSLGYASALILAIQTGYLTSITVRLAYVGRMALSNYLAQSVICTFIFYSYGLGLYGRVPRLGLVPIVFGVWILELWWSPKWLEKHAFGPVEWLWRSLTYRKLQPFRKD